MSFIKTEGLEKRRSNLTVTTIFRFYLLLYNILCMSLVYFVYTNQSFCFSLDTESCYESDSQLNKLAPKPEVTEKIFFLYASDNYS